MALVLTRYLVTGANGFVGTALTRALVNAGDEVVAVQRVRALAPDEPHVTHIAAERDFSGLAEGWPSAVRCDVAIHLAARVHVMQESSADAMAQYRETNVAGSLRVAQAAAQAGVRRFVFVSSIKAMGDTEPGDPPRPWREADIPMPADPYGITKWEAETELRAFCDRAGMECVIVRPPLVYGPGVRANFLQLLSVIGRGFPLPLASVCAQRSMVYVDNLVDALRVSATHAQAAGHTFLVSDGEDFSVADLARVLGDAMGRPARVIPCPVPLLAGLARLTGKQSQADRLLHALRVDIGHIGAQLGWQPPVSGLAGLRRTAQWYRAAFLSKA